MEKGELCVQYSFSHWVFMRLHIRLDRSKSKWEDPCIKSSMKIRMVLDNLNRHGFNCTAFWHLSIVICFVRRSREKGGKKREEAKLIIVWKLYFDGQSSW